MEDKKKPVCRACLNFIDTTETCYDLFQKYEDILSPDDIRDNILIVTKMIAISKLEIIEDDGLPNRICSSCFLELDKAYKFKRKCEKSDENLRLAKTYDSVSAEQAVDIKKENLDLEFDYSDEDDMSLAKFNHSEESKPGDKLQINNVEEENVCNQSGGNNSHTSAPSLSELQQTDIKPYCDEVKSEVKVANYSIQEKKRKGIDLKLECHDCGNVFKSKCKMRVHWKKAHKTIFTCPNCKLQFKSYRAFYNHQKIKTRSCLNASVVNIVGEGKSAVFYCKQCDYSSKHRSMMANHLIVHLKECPFSCEHCGMTFTRSQTLRYHKERAHKQYFGQITCHVCGIIILGIYNFSIHMHRHRKKQVQCDICKKFLASKESLIDHIRRHSGKKVFNCNICDSKFSTSSGLCNHKKVHDTKKYYMCRFCGYKLRNPYKLKSHEKKHNPFNVGCEMCGSLLENESQLSMHLQRHLDKHHSCEFCKKTFYSRKSLTQHLRSMHKVFVSKGNYEIKRPRKKVTCRLKCVELK